MVICDFCGQIMQFGKESEHYLYAHGQMLLSDFFIPALRDVKIRQFRKMENKKWNTK